MTTDSQKGFHRFTSVNVGESADWFSCCINVNVKSMDGTLETQMEELKKEKDLNDCRREKKIAGFAYMDVLILCWLPFFVFTIRFPSIFSDATRYVVLLLVHETGHNSL